MITGHVKDLHAIHIFWRQPLVQNLLKSERKHWAIHSSARLFAYSRQGASLHSLVCSRAGQENNYVLISRCFNHCASKV